MCPLLHVYGLVNSSSPGIATVLSLPVLVSPVLFTLLLFVFNKGGLEMYTSVGIKTENIKE